MADLVMNTSTRSVCRRLALLALGGALTLSLAPLAAAASSSSPALQPLADNAAPPPLKATFHKAKSGTDEGVYTLRLRNTSVRGMMVSATIIASVPVHNESKVREEPAHHISAGAAWAIKHLAAGDKITVKVDGYAPLELTVP